MTQQGNVIQGVFPLIEPTKITFEKSAEVILTYFNISVTVNAAEIINVLNNTNQSRLDLICNWIFIF